VRLGERIRESRRQQDLTLKQLSEISGLSVSHISAIERSHAQPSIETLSLISRSLGTSVAALTHGVDDWGDQPPAVPPGLDELRTDPMFADELSDDEWIRVLSTLSVHGQRPQTKREFLEVYLALRPHFAHRGASR